MKAFFTFACLVSFSLLAARELDFSFRDADAAFQQFKQNHKKSYKNAAEENQRREHFRKNYQRIQDCNNAGGSSRCGVNELSDWSDGEFEASLGTRIPQSHAAGRMIFNEEQSIIDRQTTATIDWTSDPCMPAIKNQGQCGSCWAFAATAPLEFAMCKANSGNSFVLSEQQLVDCSSGYGNHGCNGGFYTNAWNYTRLGGGQATQASYPYTATVGTCNYTSSMKAGTVSKWSYFKSLTNIIAAVSTGPVAVALNASLPTFKQYKSGIFSDPACNTSVNHGVVIAGFGTENGTDYWIVRNSWGTTWGLNGYMKIERGVNRCGIESYVYNVTA